VQCAGIEHDVSAQRIVYAGDTAGAGGDVQCAGIEHDVSAQRIVYAGDTADAGIISD
jgi:hypothetical protein